MSGIKREYGQTNRCTADDLTILVALWFIYFKLILPK